jgi:ABC-type transport system involved in cytochrome c biogenesis permease subunit
MRLEIKIFCFVASYLAALGLELWHHFRPQPVLRRLGQVFGAAGLVAQTYYLLAKPAPLASQYGWMLFLAWILAVFYLFGSFHYQRLGWGVFVLPVVLGLVGLGSLGALLDPRKEEPPKQYFLIDDVLSFQAAHATLLLLATVGLCVGFVASLMYLYQAHRLRTKRLPSQGPRMLSLERLEMMNRRAVVVAFPLLTVGMLIGVALMFVQQLKGWTDPRVLSAFVLWAAFAVLVYLRFGAHLRGRRIAVWTIVTFGLLLCCLTLSHPVGQGGGR